MAEFELLRKFYLTSNENGLKVYHTNAVLVYERLAMDELLKTVITEPWLLSDLENVTAVAQHYGVMTRLFGLDV